MKSQNEISIRKTTKGWLVVAPLVYRLFTDYEAMMDFVSCWLAKKEK